MKTFKGNKLYILKYIFPYIWLIIFSFIAEFLLKEKIEKLHSIYFLGILIIMLLSLILSYIYSVHIKLIITKDSINVQSGLFYQTKKIFFNSDIASISCKKSGLDSILHNVLVEIKINDRSNKLKHIYIYLSDTEFNSFKTYLTSYCNVSSHIFENNECKNHIKFNINEIFIKSISESFFIFVVGLFIYLSSISIKILDSSITIEHYISSAIYLFSVVIIIYSLIYTINFIKFYNFTIKYNKNNLVFTYGLIKKKQYEISKNNITSIIIKQHSIDRILKKATVKIDCTEEEMNSVKRIKQKYLFPYCDVDYIDELKNILNLDLIDNPIISIKPEKYSVFDFVIVFPILKILLIIILFNILGIKNFLFIYTMIPIIYIFLILEGFVKADTQSI